MTVDALVIEAENVLYQQREGELRLNAYLHSLGLSARHPKIVAKGLKAARFDALHGRISRETYYDAILRFHGVVDEEVLAVGRNAILQDTQDIITIEPFPEILQELHAAGIQLSVVTNTELTSEEMVDMLTSAGYLPTMWTYALASAEVGYMVPDPVLFEAVIDDPQTTVVLSSRPIPWLAHQGTATLIFQPGSRSNDPQVMRTPDEVLHTLLS